MRGGGALPIVSCMTSAEPGTRPLRESIRVLLIEDHQHVLWGLEKLIDGEWPRLQVSATASTLEQAAEALRRRDSDVVVLDVFLGAHNSLEQLAALAVASGAALLVHTGSRDPQLHRRALECGAFAVVLKEEPAEVLLKEIERADAARRGADSAGATKAAVEGR